MTAIDWPEVLDRHGIEYVDSGPSTSKNNIYVHCPLCGDADGGHHMGIHLRGKGWGCWREEAHRGRDPYRLLAILLDMPYDQAKELLGGAPMPEDESIGKTLRRQLGMEKTAAKVQAPRVLEVPREFRPLKPTGLGKPFYEYIRDRGYQDSDMDFLTRKYFLHYATDGLMRYRVIFLVHTQKGLVSWTGRSIVPDREPRYLTLTTDSEVANGGPVAKETIKDTLLGERSLFKNRGRVLVVGEGPMDGMRLDYIGREFNARGTCLFGKTVSEAQASTLADLSDRYEKVVLLLDPDAALRRLSTISRLAGLKIRSERLDGNAEDPGAASKRDLRRFYKRILGD